MRQPDKTARHRYVVTQAAPNRIQLSSVLRAHSEVLILEELDASTVLVEMSEEARKQLTREFPDLVVESNRQYELLAR